eukprot:TRINITY_DN61033_c0_g1_i1.p1 TRINITY_DN61033_c0_g1~~TRINITY_DN61033_c0_g1_i1.p1  ORF type:complete len:707 (-),score=152.77 TRINITY_DN61033_c0_g1_i1:32-2152(-)
MTHPGPGMKRAGPFGPGSSITVCTHGACASMGSGALLSDLEDIGPYAKIRVAPRGCLGFCGQGPNCLLEPPDSSGRSCAERRIDSFSKGVALVRKALEGAELTVPKAVLQRAQLKSDAMRLLSASRYRQQHIEEDMLKAEQLLTGAIELEAEALAARDSRSARRLRELRMLRGRALGRCCLGSERNRSLYAERAARDFKQVITDERDFAPAYIELAKICSFMRRLPDAIALYQQALELSTHRGPASGVAPGEVEAVKRSLAKLQVRLAEGSPCSEMDLQATDSGDGSGRWKVSGITGLSWDTCIYHLENLPPAEGHPFPHHAWHVQVWMGTTMREYTPVSSAAAWEDGKLDLLVKTYLDGNVSKGFALLRTAEEALSSSLESYTPLEEQPCWVQVSPPLLTLSLPSLSEQLDAPGGVPAHLSLVVGGTGIAPGLQLLREVIDPAGAFGPACRATLLSSSRTAIDVLCIDELRAAEAASRGRVRVRHTLTDESALGDDDPWDALPQQQHFRGKHCHFASFFETFEPKAGELQVGPGQEAGLRGRVNVEMLRAELPPPGPGHRVVLCGPQGFMDGARDALLTLGHAPDACVTLKATAIQQRKAPASKPNRSNSAAREVQQSNDWGETDSEGSSSKEVAQAPRIVIKLPGASAIDANQATKLPAVAPAVKVDGKDTGSTMRGSKAAEALRGPSTFADRVRLVQLPTQGR